MGNMRCSMSSWMLQELHRSQGDQPGRLTSQGNCYFPVLPKHYLFEFPILLPICLTLPLFRLGLCCWRWSKPRANCPKM